MYKGQKKTKKMNRRFAYVAIITLLAPLVLQTNLALADEIKIVNNVTEEKSTLDNVDSNIIIDSFPSIKTSEKNMYTIGITEDGRKIQSSAVSAMTRSTGNVQGQVIRITIGGILYEGIKITIDGKGALCIDQNLRAPFEANVPYDNGSPYENDGALAILSHGAYGPNNPNPSDEEILLTEIALRNWLTGNISPTQAISNSHPYVANLIEKAQKGDYIQQSFEFNKQTVESNIVDGKQVSENFVTKGNSNNYVRISIPENVTLNNLTTGEKVTKGEAIVYGGQKFNISAPLDYDSDYNSGNLTAAFGKPVALMFTPFNVGYQRLLQGNFDDPQTVSPISVNFFARTGKYKFAKQDKVTGNFVAGVTAKVTINGDAKEIVTGADGTFTDSTEYIDGTTGSISEITAPAGYVVDTTPVEFTIRGGEIITVTKQNDIQKATTTVEKTKEVYNAEESTKQGQPVYEMVEAPEIPFTQKSTTDITAPDGTTIIEKAGEYTDTQTTGADGNATFKPFYNGAQNEYLLTEDETPENYRPMEPKKIVVPYGESSVSVVAHTEKVQNLLKKGKLIFNKKNQLDPSNPLNLAGAKFHLTGQANTNTADVNLVYETTTESTEMNLKDGVYFAEEIQNPDGFTQAVGQTSKRQIVIKDGETTVIDWENAPITPETPKTPKTTTSIVPVSTKTTGTLPHTGETSNSWVSVLGAMIIVTGVTAFVLYDKKKNKKSVE